MDDWKLVTMPQDMRADLRTPTHPEATPRRVLSGGECQRTSSSATLQEPNGPGILRQCGEKRVLFRPRGYGASLTKYRSANGADDPRYLEMQAELNELTGSAGGETGAPPTSNRDPSADYRMSPSLSALH
jgi:hypothetical protein